MEIYLVGGAVRDRLLGDIVTDRDWVVVGATVDDMLAKGFKPVGKDFPVFLHPNTKEEYALARTERKVSKGYKGFVFNADPSITLQQDLQRRDLTINAIAQTKGGRLIDPFHGEQDLQDKILRHVSPAFSEDPVRILRVARFAAKLPAFTVHPTTIQLMHEMVTAGEVDALVAERVWLEFQKALNAQKPQRFFEVLGECDALHVLFPELVNKPQAFITLAKATTLSPDLTVRFAALCYALSPKETQALCSRLHAPSAFRDLALLVNRHHPAYEELNVEDGENIVTLFESLDCLRRPERLPGFVIACQANQPPEQVLLPLQWMMQALDIVRHVETQSLVKKGLSGPEFGQALHRARVEKLMEELGK